MSVGTQDDDRDRWMRAGRQDGRVRAVAYLIEAIVEDGGDLGDLLSSALGHAAGALGGVEELVRGRPGSWEAGHVRALGEQYYRIQS